MFINYILPLIITIMFIVFYVVFFTVKYKDSSDDEKMKPIKWLYYILVVAEVLKIFYLIMENQEFRPLRYPLVFCSTIFYTIPLFMCKTRFSNFGKIATVYASIVAFVLFSAIQWMYKMSLIQGHSYFYHGAMMAIALYMITSKLYKFNRKDYYKMFLFLFIYTLFASVLSLYIGEDISLFGPNSSYLAFIFKPFGYFLGMLVLQVMFYLACLGIFSLISVFTKIKKKG